MDNKTQNLVTKVTTYAIVFLGVLFTVWVMNDDNPTEMSYEQQKQWAIIEAKDQGLADQMTASELNAHLSQRTSEIAEEKQENLWNDVSTLIDFSNFIIILAVVLVLAAFVYLAMLDSKKAIKALIGLGVFSVFILIVYLFSTNVSDQELNDYNSKLLNIDVEKSDIVMAKMAITSTLILIAAAGLGWIGSPLFKYFRK
jgi:heme/copper-type cytochrome/quinol oxidase subunit 4